MPWQRIALTVDAVIPYQGGVVLIQRLNPPFQGAWAIPGGFVEPGETVEAACVREAEEETGLAVEIERLVGVYSDPKRDPRGHTVSVVFRCLPTGGRLRPQSDARAVRVFKVLPQALAFDHAKILKDAGF